MINNITFFFDHTFASFDKGPDGNMQDPDFDFPAHLNASVSNRGKILGRTVFVALSTAFYTNLVSIALAAIGLGPAALAATTISITAVLFGSVACGVYCLFFKTILESANAIKAANAADRRVHWPWERVEVLVNR